MSPRAVLRVSRTEVSCCLSCSFSADFSCSAWLHIFEVSVHFEITSVAFHLGVASGFRHERRTLEADWSGPAAMAVIDCFASAGYDRDLVDRHRGLCGDGGDPKTKGKYFS